MNRLMLIGLGGTGGRIIQNLVEKLKEYQLEYVILNNTKCLPDILSIPVIGQYRHKKTSLINVSHKKISLNNATLGISKSFAEKYKLSQFSIDFGDSTTGYTVLRSNPQMSISSTKSIKRDSYVELFSQKRIINSIDISTFKNDKFYNWYDTIKNRIAFHSISQSIFTGGPFIKSKRNCNQSINYSDNSKFISFDFSDYRHLILMWEILDHCIITKSNKKIYYSDKIPPLYYMKGKTKRYDNLRPKEENRNCNLFERDIQTIYLNNTIDNNMRTLLLNHFKCICCI